MAKRGFPCLNFESDSLDDVSILHGLECLETLVRLQHPLQMLGIPSPSSLSFSLTVARAAERRNLDVANRVRLIFTARCTGGAR
jgi:hypothetical protein